MNGLTAVLWLIVLVIAAEGARCVARRWRP